MLCVHLFPNLLVFGVCFVKVCYERLDQVLLEIIQQLTDFLHDLFLVTAVIEEKQSEVVLSLEVFLQIPVSIFEFVVLEFIVGFAYC